MAANNETKIVVLSKASDKKHPRDRITWKGSQGVFLVTAKNAFLPIEHVYRVNTYLRILTVPQGSERSE